MNVIVNFPSDIEEINELENRVAKFYAMLIIEVIQKIEISDENKDKALRLFLDDLEKAKSV